MKILQNFSFLNGKDQNLIRMILKFPEISQRKLSNFSENDFPRVRKKMKKVTLVEKS